MTPAINLLHQQKVPFDLLQYQHDASASSYANEAAEKLDIPPEQVFKTLVVEVDANTFVVALVSSNDKLSMKKLAKACGAKKAKMAEAQQVQNVTGYVLGGVSPFGQKKKLRTIVDASALKHASVYVSGGRRGLEIAISPAQLVSILKAQTIDLSA